MSTVDIDLLFSGVCVFQNKHANPTDPSQIDKELSMRQERQLSYDQKILALGEDIELHEAKLRDKQQAIGFLEDELQEKQELLNESMRIDQDPTNVYGPWMSDCLKDVQNDQRFHRKPIGPIGNATLPLCNLH
jgi:hypothetical protein